MLRTRISDFLLGTFPHGFVLRCEFRKLIDRIAHARPREADNECKKATGAFASVATMSVKKSGCLPATVAQRGRTHA
jgi:hypothetical protein